jgi:hypothetical protein
MYRATRIVAIVLFGMSLTAMAGDSGAERHKAEIVTKADSLFRQRYRPPADKPLVTFDKDRESGSPDAVIYWFNANYVVRLILTTDGSLARVELLPEALLHADSWTSVPDAVELGRGEMQWLIDTASQLRPTGDPVSIHQPPDACFQSGPNLYCGDSYELAALSKYCHEHYRDEPSPQVSLRAVTIAYKQSVSGIVSDIKAVSANEHHLKIGPLRYRILKQRDQPLFITAAVGSIVSLTTFGCAGNELTCDAFPPPAPSPTH